MEILINAPSVNPTVAKVVKELWDAHRKDISKSPKISTIKSIRAIFNLGLLESKDLLEIVIDARPITDTVWGRMS